ncbi:MAG: hypothetical protein IKO06_03925 [Alphaproteobacteria bacterium]|nr:hypothetical protein [Alphaproteobacteria bacterium]
MGIAFLYYVLFLLFGCAAMYCSFAPQAKKIEKNGKFTFFMQPIIYVFFLYALGSVGAYYLTDNHDFIAGLNLGRIILPLGCAIFIYAASFVFGERASIVAVLMSVAACVFYQNVEPGFVPFGLNVYVFKFLAIVFFSVFCLCYNILNVLPHTIVIITSVMLMGVSLLSGVGGAPAYLALVSAILIGSLFGFLSVNFNRVKIEFDDISCCILAFLVANLLILDIPELSFSSCVVFTLVFWAELAIAAYRRFFISKTGSLRENSYLLSVAQKLTIGALMNNIFKIGLVAVFFGWFQLFSVNQYSLILVTFFVVLWLNTSMGANLLQTPKSLKQINSEFIADIKKNFNETISQIKNKKD